MVICKTTMIYGLLTQCELKNQSKLRKKRNKTKQRKEFTE